MLDKNKQKKRGGQQRDFYSGLNKVLFPVNYVTLRFEKWSGELIQSYQWLLSFLGGVKRVARL